MTIAEKILSLVTDAMLSPNEEDGRILFSATINSDIRGEDYTLVAAMLVSDKDDSMYVDACRQTLINSLSKEMLGFRPRRDLDKCYRVFADGSCIRLSGNTYTHHYWSPVFHGSEPESPGDMHRDFGAESQFYADVASRQE